MTLDQQFRILILVTLFANLAVSVYFRRKADRQGGDLDPSGNRVLFFLRLAALVFLVPLIGFLININWMGWARYDSPEWLRWIGFGLATISIPGLYWLFSTIGNNISPTHSTREDHQLVTDGPYRFVRHPLYPIGFTFFLGISLMATMWWLQVGLVILGAVIVWRTGKEEENLLREFGEQYQTYMKRTGRYLPKLF